MNVRNIEPNNVISVKELIEVEGKAKIKFIDDRGIEKEANLIIENSDKKMLPASLKDWNTFMSMLGDTAVSAGKLQEMELAFGKEIDKQVSAITARFATEPENIPTLAAELGQLTAKKSEIVANMIEEESEKLREEAKNRKNFFVGGIMRSMSNDEVSRGIEIPQPSKKARNIKTIANHEASVNFSFITNGKPLKVEDIANVDISKVIINTQLSPINSNNIVNKVFDINENCVNGLSGTKGEMLYKKLLDIYGKSDAAKELITFKKENDFEDLTVEKIERLKELYSNVKDDILSNGMSGYNVGLKVFYDNDEKQRLLERMSKGIANGVMKKLTGIDELPKEVELTNINGMHKIPTNVVNGVDMADQWYASIKTRDGKITNISAPVSSTNNEEFSSSGIQEQIREIALKEKELELSNNDMDK